MEYYCDIHKVVIRDDTYPGILDAKCPRCGKKALDHLTTQQALKCFHETLEKIFNESVEVLSMTEQGEGNTLENIKKQLMDISSKAQNALLYVELSGRDIPEHYEFEEGES